MGAAVLWFSDQPYLDKKSPSNVQAFSNNTQDKVSYDLPSLPDKLFYSLDELLPIVELNKKHGDVNITGWAKYYFYIHKISGWVLGSFLVAGLAGLDPRNPELL